MPRRQPGSRSGQRQPFNPSTPQERYKRHARPGQQFEITAPPKPSPASKSRSGGQVPEEFQDAARGIRLQKYLAEAGVASRRACEAMIAQGRVRVNRQVVNALPAWINPFADTIEIDGEELPRPKGTVDARRKARNAGHESPKVNPNKSLFDKVYIALNKPRRSVSTTHDPEGRQTVLDMVDLPHNVAGRLYPVGRLDADSTGLILLTNDGDLAQRLTHPRYGVPKRYHVSIRGRLTQQDIDTLMTGALLAHRKAYIKRADTGPEQSVVVRRAAIEEARIMGYNRDQTRGDHTKVELVLREGQNREIRRLMARLGFQVRKLQRVAVGPVTLKGINAGEWRFLSEKEIKQLQAAAPKEPRKPARTPRPVAAKKPVSKPSGKPRRP